MRRRNLSADTDLQKGDVYSGVLFVTFFRTIPRRSGYRPSGNKSDKSRGLGQSPSYNRISKMLLSLNFARRALRQQSETFAIIYRAHSFQ